MEFYNYVKAIKQQYIVALERYLFDGTRFLLQQYRKVWVLLFYYSEIIEISVTEKPRKSKDTVYNFIEKKHLFGKARRSNLLSQVAKILATLSGNENFTRLRKNKIKIYTYNEKAVTGI